MKHIQIRVSDEEYNIIKLAAQHQGITAGVLVKNSILKSTRTNQDADLSEGIEVVRGSKEKLWVYIQEHEKAILVKNAEFHGWSTSREAVFRLMSTMLSSHGEVVLYPDEVDALKKARNAVDIVGRNIKFLIDGKGYVADNDANLKEDIGKLLVLSKEIKDTVNSMVNTVLNRWNKRKS